MPVFSYQAVSTSAAAVSGTIAADSPREAREKLRAQGLIIEAIRPSGAAKSEGGAFPILTRILDRPGRRAARLGMAVRDLATLLGTGIGLVDALDTLTQQHRGRFQAALLALRERVAAGSSLAQERNGDRSFFTEIPPIG